MIDFQIYQSATVRGGRIEGLHKKKFAEELKYFEGKSIEVIVRRKRKQRSVAQNKTWWLYMSILADHLGYDKETMHQICKMKFLKREAVDEKTGEILEYLESTKKLTTLEFSELFEKLYLWSSETFRIVLPKPNEQIEIM